nr:PREDICTED: serine/threonine/tyrosine-interacting protein-like isoform X1 [Linepithema humile]
MMHQFFYKETNSITRYIWENTRKRQGIAHDPGIPKFFDLDKEKKEWIYIMRRCMQEVIPNIFLGPYSVASRSKLQSLLDHGITHIICVRHTIEANFIKPNFPDNFKYLVLNIADTEMENIIQHFQKVKAFIDESLHLGGRVLIHGNAGISRSAALVLAYIMETYELSLERAYCVLLRRRFCINPNEGFLTQLREYEPLYQARKATQIQQSSDQCNKRTISQMDIDMNDSEEDKIKSIKT